MPEPLVKVCGLTRMEDAMVAAQAGADFLGYILAPSSKRRVDADQIAPVVRAIRIHFPHVLQFGVVMNPTADELESLMAGNIFDGVQLHGDEPASIATSIRDAGYLVIRAVPIGLGAPEHDWLSYPCDYRLADTYHDGQSGGTGKRLDPSLIPGSDHRGPQPLLIAGGLTPLNVEQAMNQFPAQGVDVSSGVEVSPGIKDHEAIRTFVTRAKALNPINLDR